MKESVLRLILDARRAKSQGRKAIERRQHVRFIDIVKFARTHSPYYRDFYRDLPQDVTDIPSLPVTDKKALMARFDDWATDRDLRIANVQALIDSPQRVGERYLGKYTVATTSGTTGRRGIFVLDDRTMAVTNAMAARMLGSWLSFTDVLRIVARGARMAMVMATGGHFASAVAAARLSRGSARRSRRIGVFPANTPMPALVDHLNRFQPALLAPYASMAALLASEQEAGRLHIRPVLLALSAEGLPQQEYVRIAKAFDAKVGNSYAATECTFLSYGCREGWLHVNADWVLLEPVDAQHRPVAPGVQSHTVLLTNLANRVQPIIRYDLGDSVVQRPDACPCGNPLPAIRVTGRAADVLTFPTTNGERRSLPPLAFGGVLDSLAGVEQAQIVQTAPDRVRIRLRLAPRGDPDRVWAEAIAGIDAMLAKHDLRHVAVERANELPEQSPGGKFREVVPLTVSTGRQ